MDIQAHSLIHVAVRSDEAAASLEILLRGLNSKEHEICFYVFPKDSASLHKSRFYTYFWHDEFNEKKEHDLVRQKALAFSETGHSWKRQER